MRPSVIDPIMIPEFPENRENNREFFGFLSPAFYPFLIECVKYFIIKLQTVEPFHGCDFGARKSTDEWKAESRLLERCLGDSIAVLDGREGSVGGSGAAAALNVHVPRVPVRR